MKNSNFEQILEKYQRGELNESQRKFVEDWLQSISDSETKVDTASWSNQELQMLYKKIQLKKSPARRFTFYKWAAAAVLLLAFFSIYKIKNSPVTEVEISATQIFPVQDSVLLILENGEQIYLDQNQQSLTVSNQGLSYADGSLLNEAEITVENLQLQIPKGRQFQLTLGDGTKVWLNAGTILKYPSVFDSKERRVELIGEAYFEVAHQTIKDSQNKEYKKPFIVKSANQEVFVLGTKFNISAYANQVYTTTSLLDGSVRVVNNHNESKVLVPGKQSLLTENPTIQIVDTNIESVLDWKNNLFVFHNSNLREVLSKISQWYDIDVDIDKSPNERFYGEIQRNKPLSEVLDMIQLSSELKFKILQNGKERRLMVY